MCLLAGIAKWVENRIKDISFIHQPPKNLRLNLRTEGVSGRILYHGKVLIHANQKIRIHFHFYTDRILFSTTHTNCSNKSGGPFFLRRPRFTFSGSKLDNTLWEFPWALVVLVAELRYVCLGWYHFNMSHVNGKSSYE